MSRPVGIPRRDDNERSAGASAIIKGIFSRIRESGKTYKEVVAEAGLDKKTLTSWRGDDVFPQLDSVTRCLRVLGFSLVIVRQEERRLDMAISLSQKQPRRKIEIPRGDDDEWSAGAHTIVDMIFHYIGESGKTYENVGDEAGLDGETLESWRDETVFPRLDSVLRCLRVLGYSLVIVKSEDSAFAHPGYFEMQDRREAVRRRKAGIPPTTVPGTPAWKEAMYAPWREPTPEETATEIRHQRLNGNISAKNEATLSPEERIRLLAESEAFHEERRKLAEASSKRRAEEHRKRIDEMRQGRKRKGEATPVVKSRKASPNRKAKMSAKMARMRERIAQKARPSGEIFWV